MSVAIPAQSGRVAAYGEALALSKPAQILTILS